jgi:hypothetical protein
LGRGQTSPNTNETRSDQPTSRQEGHEGREGGTWSQGGGTEVKIGGNHSGADANISRIHDLTIQTETGGGEMEDAKTRTRSN